MLKKPRKGIFSKAPSKTSETSSEKRTSLLKRLTLGRLKRPKAVKAQIRRPIKVSIEGLRSRLSQEKKPIFEKNRLREEIISSKYTVPQKAAAHVADWPFEFPAGYGDNRICLMTRDPWWVYSYWEVRNEVEEETRRKIEKSGARPVKSILRVYDVTDINFNGHNAHRYFDIGLSGSASNWYIHVEHPNRSWCVDIGILADNGHFYTLARSNVVRTPRYGPSDILDEEWMIPDEAFWRIFGLSGGYGVGKSSMELKKLIEKHLKEQIWSGGMFSGVSSFRQVSKQKKFWLVVDCELIVYGATEPDAQVTVQGRPLKLRKDGTFTLRFALPDGVQNIPVVATNRDGDDTRSITPIVTRRTERNP